MSAKKKEGTAIAKWDERLAKYAEAAAAVEANTHGGIKSFSIKAGVLSLDDVPFKNNEMAAIVLDHVLLNRYDAEDYDPDVMNPPTCFAIGRAEEEMVPHPSVVARGQQQHEKCEGCPMNEWGSAKKGRGKACGNRRRLVVIPAGEFLKDGQFEMIDDPDHYTSAEAAFFTVPVTSTVAWATYVKQLKTALKRPPFAFVTKIKVQPNEKTIIQVTFDAIKEIEDPQILEKIMDRHDATQELAMTPLGLDFEESEKSARRGGKRGSSKPASRAAAAKGAKTNARRY